MYVAMKFKKEKTGDSEEDKDMQHKNSETKTKIFKTMQTKPLYTLKTTRFTPNIQSAIVLVSSE